QTMISQGNYSRLVDIHADMDHRVHSMNGPVGTRRFLPWHRIYLTKLEAELRIVDASLYVPYWDWANDRDVPAWLKDFLPRGATRNLRSLTLQAHHQVAREKRMAK